MLRITESIEESQTVRLRIDGNLTETCYPELEAICQRHRETNGSALVLDMAGVVFMQAAVAKKLATLRGEHLQIINCSPFIETLLETVTR